MINDYSSISGRYKFFSSRPKLKDLIITSPQQKSKLQESEQLVQHLSTLQKRQPTKKPKAQQFKLYQMVKSKQLVSEFLMRLRQKAQQISFNNLQRNPIFQKERFLFEKRNQTSQKYLDALGKCPLIKPQSKLCIIFDSISVLLILITLWAYPFMFAFTSFDENIFKMLIESQLLAEILFNCNKITYQEGQVKIYNNIKLVNDRKRIIQFYFKQQGVIDLLFLISNALIILGYYNIYIQIFTTILIILRLSEKVRLYQDNLYLQGTISEFIDLLLLLVTVYYFTHIVACSWFKVGNFSEYLGTSWIIQKQLENQSDWMKYNSAFYWATMTMTTIGYGDVSAQNQLEILFSNIVMIISSFLFGYSINSMGTIIRNQYEKNQQYKYYIYVSKTINSDPQYLYEKQLSELEYTEQEKFNQTLQEVDNITQILPQSLKFDLNQNIKIKIVNQIPVLKNNFRPQTLTNIAENFEFLQYTPNELIYQQNSLDRYLYFVVDGKVTLQEQKSNLVLQHIERGGLFGNYQFFTNFNPKQTAISDSFVQLCRISREKFMQCLKIQQEFQIFKNIQDQIIFNRDYSCAYMKCNLCGKSDHENIDCQSINFYPDIEKIIKSENFKINRRRYTERQNQRVNTLLNLKTITDCAELWADQNSIYTQSNISDVESDDRQQDKTSDVPDDKSISYKPDTIHHRQRNKNTINLQKSKNIIMSMSHLSKYGSKSIVQGKDGPRNTILYQTAGNIKKIQDQLGFDKLFNYINYFPHNNLEQTILQIGKKKQTSLKFKEYLKTAGKYMFYFIPRMMSTKIQMKLRRKLSSPF